MATKNNGVRREGIVLRVTEMKESDAMVAALGEDGFFSFYAHGVRKYGAANGPATQALAESQFLLSESSDGSYTLKEAALARLLLPQGDLTGYAVASLVLELANKLLQEEEARLAYPYIRGALESVADGREPLASGLICFAHLLSFAGIGLEVDSCVLCGSQANIVSLSYADGGYVCASCFDPESMERLPRRALQILRYIFRAPSSDYGRVHFEPEELLPLYARLSQYLEEMSGIRLKSAELIEKL